MQFTGLETILIASLSAAVAIFVALIAFSSRFMSRTECEARHRNICLPSEDVAKILQDLKLLFRMVRAIVISLPIDNEKKEEILNDRA